MRVVWFVLDSGRSVIAACGTATHDAVQSALSRSNAVITVAGADSTEQFPTAAVRDFLVFETGGRFTARSAFCPSLML